MKVGIITATRAEYGLLYPVVKKLMSDPFFEVELTVTGSHLSEEHGYTLNAILTDNIKVSNSLKIDVSDNLPDGICRQISQYITNFSSIFKKSGYNLLIVLGDRYELLGICSAAVIHRIPIVHIHGGEITSGAIDDCIRHSITKMSAIHFASTEEYRRRIVQMGENPKHY